MESLEGGIGAGEVHPSKALSKKSTGLTVRGFGTQQENTILSTKDFKNGSKTSKTALSTYIEMNGKTVGTHMPLGIVAPLAPKASFEIYCDDDDETQDAGKAEFMQPQTARGNTVSLPTDFSSFEQEDNENKDPKDEASAADGDGFNENETKEEDDEDDFASAVDTNSLSEYLTAPMPSEKELHEDRMLYHPDYARDIYEYMCHLEERLRPRANYMSKQTEVNHEMRVILIDWLADVAVEYEFSQETFHLAVSLVDRTLSVVDCPRLKLQLVGAAAAMIASKFEEVYPPELKEFVYITDDTYTGSQILRMEKVILSCLRFQICMPTSNWFGSRLTRELRSPKRTVHLMNYLLELALLNHKYLKHRNSRLACAALCLANILTGPVPWPADAEADTGVTLDELLELVSELLESFRMAGESEHKAVFDKYSSSKYDSVANITAPLSLPTIP